MEIELLFLFKASKRAMQFIIRWFTGKLKLQNTTVWLEGIKQHDWQKESPLNSADRGDKTELLIISFFLLSFHPHTPQDHNAESLSLNCLSVRWLPWLRSVLILRLCTLTAMHGAGSTNQTSIMTCRPYFFPRLSDDALMIRDSQWEDVI